MLVVNRDGLFYFIYHDAGLRLMLEHLLQNPKNQGLPIFGCGSAATLILRILDFRVSSITEIPRRHPWCGDVMIVTICASSLIGQFMTELVQCVSPNTAP